MDQDLTPLVREIRSARNTIVGVLTFLTLIGIAVVHYLR